MAATRICGRTPGGEKFWVKYHFKTDQGIEFFTDAKARAMTAEDPDYHLRDLYQAIGRRDHPAWTLRMQIMPFEEAAGYRFNPFAVAKVWPHGDYPLVTVGRLILDRNPENYLQLPVCNRPSAPAGDLRE
jgi:catalase